VNTPKGHPLLKRSKSACMASGADRPDPYPPRADVGRQGVRYKRKGDPHRVSGPLERANHFQS